MHETSLTPVAQRPRILALTSEPPWPLNSGGHIRTFHLLSALARQAELRVICPIQPHQQDAVVALRERGLDLVGAAVDKRTPFGETQRLWDSLSRSEPYVMYRRHAWRGVEEAIRSEVAAFRPDVAYFDHLDSLVYREASGGIPAAVDLHNVYSLLVRRSAEEQRSKWRSAFLRREARLLEAMEQRAVRTADLLFAVSQQEAAHFKAAGAKSVHVIPNGVDCAAVADLPTGRSNPPTVLFLGAMSWAPNINAAQFLIDLLPALRKRVEGATVVIVGRDPPPQLTAQNALPGVEVTGSVPEVKPYLLRGTVMAVPLTAGGGTRLKILEAFAAGLPVISTGVGAEGIDATPGQHLVIAERSHFVDALADMLLSRDRNQQVASEARTLARAKYDWERIGPGAARLVTAIAATHNGIGSLDTPLQPKDNLEF